ncbi:MAG: HlyD family efflux transporter periplasmic adaptor subunit [Pseudomonadota bacterium]
MRLLRRTLLGTALLCMTLGLLAMAVGTVYRATTAEEDDGRRGAPRERSFSVNLILLEPVRAVPRLTAYGEVESRRTLEIRSEVGGRIIELSQNFRAGGHVSEGEILVRLDPARARTALDIALTEEAEARADVSQADAAQLLAVEELAAAEAQRDLRSQALTRQRDLRARGAATAAAEETAELSLAQAEQSLVGRRQALAQADATLERSRITLERRVISREEAARDLADTIIRAPFAGRIGEISGVLGGLVTANEQLGTLLDPGALEVAFRVSTAEFARLAAAGSAAGQPVLARLSMGAETVAIPGRVDRAGAEVGDMQSGRVLYAQLEGRQAATLRPGDFVVVEIEEPPLDNVAVIPARAISAAGELLLLGAEDRLELARVSIRRRQGDDVIVGDVPFGREAVAELLPQLGAGVKVRPIRPAAEGSAIRLDAAQRARLRALVEADAGLPEARRAALLTTLEGETVSAELVTRLEARAGTAGSATLALDAARRARLIAYVERNERMPPDVKERLLGELNGDEVPRATVERLERRMGG